MFKSQFVSIKYTVFVSKYGQFETIEHRYDVFDTLKTDLIHNLRSVAGKNFHAHYTRSVTVFDETGEVFLHLRKEVSGACVVREYNDQL